MARWQEQEERMMKNFSIIVLAQEKVKKRGEERVPIYTPRGKVKALG
jgi:hypothetical protein